MNFTVRIKDKTEDITKGIENFTIKNLLDDLELSSETVVSKRNGEIVIEDTVIEDGDEIEFIQIIYGG